MSDVHRITNLNVTQLNYLHWIGILA